MGDVPQVNATIQNMLELASRCTQAETSDNYGALSDEVEELEAQAREIFHSRMDIASLLRKLKAQKPLTPDDLKTLELLIVGDAEYFLKYETEFDRWKSEIKQLLEQISALQSSDLDVDASMHLRALCAEFSRVLPAVVYYLDQKERTAKFQEATRKPLDPDGYRVLAEIVERMLVSNRM
jgi:chromosome segregation ATPase